MPVVFKKQLNASVSICLWQIQETEAFFLENYSLDAQDLKSISQCKQESRRLEKWACRAALAVLTGERKVSISYSVNGQPLFPEGFISFSHSKEFVLVAISNQPIGVDIEKITPRILKLKHKFMNEDELFHVDIENPEDITFFWSAKEAIYKLYEKGNLDFCDDMHISPNHLSGKLKNEFQITLNKFIYQNFMIVISQYI